MILQVLLSREDLDADITQPMIVVPMLYKFSRIVEMFIAKVAKEVISALYEMVS